MYMRTQNYTKSAENRLAYDALNVGIAKVLQSLFREFWFATDVPMRNPFDLGAELRKQIE